MTIATGPPCDRLSNLMAGNTRCGELYQSRDCSQLEPPLTLTIVAVGCAGLTVDLRVTATAEVASTDLAISLVVLGLLGKRPSELS